MIRFSSYCRVSTDKQAERFISIPTQLDACRTYVSRIPDAVIVANYEDPGISGATLDRPGLQSMLDAADRGEFDRVIVMAIDRLSREELHTLLIEDRLQRAGVWLESTIESSFADRKDESAIIMRSIVRGNAQMERAKIRRRTLDGFYNLAREQGRQNGRPPTGYKRNLKTKGWEIDEERAKLIRWMFDYVETGVTVSEVTMQLNLRGITSPSSLVGSDQYRAGGYVGNGWNRITVIQILRNVVYTGKIVHRGEVLKGAHSAIVEPDQFDKVQSLIDNRGTRRQASSQGIFAAGLVLCPHCFDKGIKSLLYVNHARLVTGEWLVKYKCSAVLKYQIGKRSGFDGVPPDHAFQIRESKIVTALAAHLSRFKTTVPAETWERWIVEIEMPKRRKPLPTTNIDDMQKRLDAIPGIIRNHQKLLAEGLENTDDYRSHVAELKEREVAMRALIAKSQTPDAPDPLTERERASLMGALKSETLTPTQKHDILASAIQHIVPSRDRKTVQVFTR